MFHPPSSIHTCTDDGTLFPPASCPAVTPAIYSTSPRGVLDASDPAFSYLLSSPSYSSTLPNFYVPTSSSSHSPSLHHHRTNSLNHPSLFSSPQHSFLHMQQHQQPPRLISSPPPPSPSGEFLDFNTAPARRVYSTGDLQGLNGLPAAGENQIHNQEEGSISSKAVRYSSDERKERIERYRSKRNQRNFHKKITYACRKTLADSRPRVRGRFARNGETEAGASVTETEAAETTHKLYNHESFEQNHSNSDMDSGSDYWLRQRQPADDEKECFNEEDFWATVADVLSMNLLS
ncbi:hypothetical protein Cni_G29135 [Canna indica]|uniref:CCT domain-containing protein n=1 Tax=Canna indica TaxID=4628 RepID=A0AAQ3L581_9LILI|nr:hypothetical protein Cni_G29135 [Canna indica]